MNSINKTLYIPLYGKSLVSRKGILLSDPKAEEIWTAEAFPLKGKSRTKWLAYYMGMRAAVYDRWLEANMEEDSSAVILHLGCGMDSRVLRVGTRGHRWYDVDFPEVIRERQRYYSQSGDYRMIGADICCESWLEALPAGNAIVVMEGVSMYLHPEALKKLLAGLCSHFEKVALLMDCYTEFAAKASRVRNPINDVGVTEVYGLDDPMRLEGSGLRFAGERDMTPEVLTDQLRGMEKRIFRSLYAGRIARKMYRLYAYRKES